MSFGQQHGTAHLQEFCILFTENNALNPSVSSFCAPLLFCKYIAVTGTFLRWLLQEVVLVPCTKGEYINWPLLNVFDVQNGQEHNWLLENGHTFLEQTGQVHTLPISDGLFLEQNWQAHMLLLENGQEILEQNGQVQMLPISETDGLFLEQIWQEHMLLISEGSVPFCNFEITTFWMADARSLQNAWVLPFFLDIVSIIVSVKIGCWMLLERLCADIVCEQMQ